MVGKKIVLPNDHVRTLAFRDFAILFRSVRNSSKAVIDELEKENISFQVRGGTSDLFECKEVDFVAKCFTFLSNLEYRGKPYSLEELATEFKGIAPTKDILNDFIRKIEKLKTNLTNMKRLDLQRTYHNILNAIGTQEGIYSDSILLLFGHFSELIKDFEDINYPLYRKDFKFFLVSLKVMQLMNIIQIMSG